MYHYNILNPEEQLVIFTGWNSFRAIDARIYFGEEVIYVNRRLLTVSEVAEIFNLSEDRVYTLSRENILPSVRLGRTLRFSAAAIEEFIIHGGRALPGIYKREP